MLELIGALIVGVILLFIEYRSGLFNHPNGASTKNDTSVEVNWGYSLGPIFVSLIITLCAGIISWGTSSTSLEPLLNWLILGGLVLCPSVYAWRAQEFWSAIILGATTGFVVLAFTALIWDLIGVTAIYWDEDLPLLLTIGLGGGAITGYVAGLLRRVISSFN